MEYHSSSSDKRWLSNKLKRVVSPQVIITSTIDHLVECELHSHSIDTHFFSFRGGKWPVQILRLVSWRRRDFYFAFQFSFSPTQRRKTKSAVSSARCDTSSALSAKCTTDLRRQAAKNINEKCHFFQFLSATNAHSAHTTTLISSVIIYCAVCVR